MRLRFVWLLGSAVLALGATAANASAQDGAGGAVAPTGGAPTAPAVVSSPGGAAPTGPTGTTGTTGSTGTTGATGSTGVTGNPFALYAPITLPLGVSPTAIYTGPVYVERTDGTVVPYVPVTKTANASGGTSVSVGVVLTHLVVPGRSAAIIGGIAAAPEAAPEPVKQIIWAANSIIGRPYVWGGGHRSFTSHGYDCSGAVSYALHGGSLLDSPLDSGSFEGWGAHGRGRWVTILTNPGHAYLDVAGIRLDTSSSNDPSNLQGTRWRPLRPANHGFVLRHPLGF